MSLRVLEVKIGNLAGQLRFPASEVCAAVSMPFVNCHRPGHGTGTARPRHLCHQIKNMAARRQRGAGAAARRRAPLCHRTGCGLFVNRCCLSVARWGGAGRRGEGDKVREGRERGGDRCATTRRAFLSWCLAWYLSPLSVGEVALLHLFCKCTCDLCEGDGSAPQVLWAKSYMVIDVSPDKLCEPLNELKPPFVGLLTR